jgi:hypothetical protein
MSLGGRERNLGFSKVGLLSVAKLPVSFVASWLPSFSLARLNETAKYLSRIFPCLPPKSKRMRFSSIKNDWEEKVVNEDSV